MEFEALVERIFFLWEDRLHKKLLEAIIPVPISKAVDSWSFELGSTFSVSSLYMYLYKTFLPPSPYGLNSIETIAKVWGTWRRPKSLFFSWQALLGRLPTRVNLTSRGIYMDGVEACCVLCGDDREIEDRFICLLLAR
jgi:hypothetical protein